MRLSPKGYPQFFHPHERRWVFTHRWVMEQIFGGPIFPGLVVHHKDRNKRNFHPSNLQVMTVGEHDHLHGFDR